MRGRAVRMQIWRLDVGRVSLYLLDTDRADNHPIDRWITARLYIGDRHTRLTQYGVLGVGGVRALAALGITGIHRPPERGARGVGVVRAPARAHRRRTFARGGLDPRPAGDRVHDTHAGCGGQRMVPVRRGRTGARPPSRGARCPPTRSSTGSASPTRRQDETRSRPRRWRCERAGRRSAFRAATVRSRAACGARCGRTDQSQDVPIKHVTNGVHTATWMAGPMQALLERHLGADWRTRLADATLWERIAAIPDAELWAVRHTLRQRARRVARERGPSRCGSRAASRPTTSRRRRASSIPRS